MKLSSLRLHGFKSFADRTEIQFHEGITAIVGPNGCGKSNISDAIRWVLGEQRPTAIRGAKMEEAIFQGTVGRRPINRGSVAMRVSNEDGALPVPFEEVEIGRTVFRDGGSDYSINRASCRLRDVHDLCRDTGLGANAYAVIESRMIDAILSDRAEERRGLFEEAAGIGKYKDRRKIAGRRLERAELDLQRLEDLIAEVTSKVRSLARQKGKAQRYDELRVRRRSVEVAVVSDQLRDLKARLTDVQGALKGGAEEGQGTVAELRTAEAEYETLRIRRVEAEKLRIDAASKLEKIRNELIHWERDLAVADERATSAERRLGQISGEREEGRGRADELTTQIEELGESRAKGSADLEESRSLMDSGREAVGVVRERLNEARASLETIQRREREVARRAAQLEGDSAAARAQATELGRRLGRLESELADTASALTDLQAQGDLFTDRLTELDRASLAARADLDEARRVFEDARALLSEARRIELAAVDGSSSLTAQRAAFETMEREQAGIEPVVRAAQDEHATLVLGTLSDCIAGPPDIVAAAESYLGHLTQGLVVADRQTATALQRWFDDAWSGGGGLVLFPLDGVPKTAPAGSLLRALRVEGQGARWVRALLARVDLVEDDELFTKSGGSASLTRSGTSVDHRGVVRIGNPMGATGLIERREKLAELAQEAEAAVESAARARAGREEAQVALEEAETGLETLRAKLAEAEDAQRAARSEEAGHVDRQTRMDRAKDELARQVEGTRATRAKAAEREREAVEEIEAIAVEESALVQRETDARRVFDTVEAEWEDARAEESRLAIQLNRHEGELERLDERLGHLAHSRTTAVERIAQLDREEEELGRDLVGAREVRAQGEEALATLFERRDVSDAELARRDEVLGEVAAALDDADRRVRSARAAERESSDRRHRLELEDQELRGRIERIEERLEAEWGRPLRVLIEEAEPVEGEPEGLEDELRDIVERMARLGPVNMLALEEHEEESARLSFLTEQRDDLIKARDDLRTAIRGINQTATRLFMETFEATRKNFRDTFYRLFQGGECDLWLSDVDDPLESAIEIHASPVGKKTQRIDLLSGGERALTALSLLFGIYLVKPSPFCVLDEVDAPLDDNNIGRFIRLLQEFKEQSQFVVITHNPRTIEAADWIYGVTMEEPGVSSVVGVRLEGATEFAETAA